MKLRGNQVAGTFLAGALLAGLMTALTLGADQNIVQNPVQNSVQNSVQDSVQNPVQNPVQNSVQNPVQNSVQNPVRNPAQNPAEVSERGESETGESGNGESERGESDPAWQAGVPVFLDESWEWAGNSAVHSGNAMLYRCGESADAPGRRGVTVCVNAGHGCEGGSAFQTLSHPDGTPKVTGGSNAEGAVYSTAISTGMTFEDGVLEAEAALMTAMALKEELLADGYDVLMIREGRDVQLDNIARTVIANNCADLHIAIHFDSTSMDKGAYFCAVPEDAAYRAMEPVASHWEEHMALGRSLLQGLSAHGFALFEGGEMQMDLTQTSYSTIPSVDIELGDRASDHSPEACGRYAQALKEGVDLFFENV